METEQEVIVEQRDEEGQAAAEAFYWGTLHDFVTLMMVYGREQVLEDFQKVTKSMAQASEPSIILPE